jgi:hypothetical protein
MCDRSHLRPQPNSILVNGDVYKWRVEAGLLFVSRADGLETYTQLGDSAPAGLARIMTAELERRQSASINR